MRTPQNVATVCCSSVGHDDGLGEGGEGLISDSGRDEDTSISCLVWSYGQLPRPHHQELISTHRRLQVVGLLVARSCQSQPRDVDVYSSILLDNVGSDIDISCSSSLRRGSPHASFVEDRDRVSWMRTELRRSVRAPRSRHERLTTHRRLTASQQVELRIRPSYLLELSVQG